MDPMQSTPGAHTNLPAPDQVPVVATSTQAIPPLSPVSGAQTSLPQQGMSQVQQVPVLQTAGYSADAPAVADDVDLIEKEWVDKAKAIVARTRDDPNKQNLDINRFKADYLKTRYSKDIAVNEP